MYVLGRRASLWVAASVAAIALWTSAAPTMTYPLYAAEWHLDATVTTGIFAVYPATLVIVLLLAGDLSDYLGRRTTILLGLATSLVGVLLFAVAPDVGVVFAGRALMGIGVGLSLTPATAAMTEFSAPGKASRAGSIATLATAAGLGLAFLVGGSLIEYAPFPTRLSFWVLAAVIAVVLVFAWFLPRHAADPATGHWHPRAPRLASGFRWIFVTSAIAMTAAFGVGTIMMSLGAQIARDLIGSNNALVTGGILAMFAVVIAVVALLAKGTPAKVAIMLGSAGTTIGMTLLAVAAAQASLVLFLASAIAMGTGYSLLFLGGLGLITANAPARSRAGAISAVYLIAYLMQGVTALLLGAVATRSGLTQALNLGAPAIAILSIAAVAASLLVSRHQPHPAGRRRTSPPDIPGELSAPTLRSPTLTSPTPSAPIGTLALINEREYTR
ncbi:MFS transporter [Cryobacterium sp. PH31-O1]|uniref:MFS transporter n=1 Tax=Cryobacterium sp. PH31-O1 TaxID=3046306 RepID=UPI0024BA7C60|nr:MFS transporter [Cryobacterium sp. PH31-O1]MDJ0337306.1 MFS transporter [Cryobacterium sp. PH31-O1]